MIAMWRVSTGPRGRLHEKLSSWTESSDWGHFAWIVSSLPIGPVHLFVPTQPPVLCYERSLSLHTGTDSNCLVVPFYWWIPVFCCFISHIITKDTATLSWHYVKDKLNKFSAIRQTVGREQWEKAELLRRAANTQTVSEDSSTQESL